MAVLADQLLDADVQLPPSRRGPFERLALRLLAALALIAFVTLVAYLDRAGYRDSNGDGITLLDAAYYATVSVTTTGYGDITPVTQESRLLTTLLITPARILFLILLVGTTLEVLAEGSRRAFREQIWRRKLRDHIIVCGYGTKGRSAIEVLTARGTPADRIVVIDELADRVEEAARAGHAAIQGNAARRPVLERARVTEAAAIIVAPHRDDTAVLMTLNARELAPKARIISAVREDDNRHLLHQSGADSVITTSGAAGRMLGFAAQAPRVVQVLEELLEVGAGLDLVERAVQPEHVGHALAEVPSPDPVIAVVRDGDLLRFDDPGCRDLQSDDRLVVLCTNARASRRPAAPAEG